MKTKIKIPILMALISVLFLAGCSKNNDIKTVQNNSPITVKNIGAMHNQILDLFYSKHVFREKESVSLKDKIAIVDQYYKEHGITPLFSTIVKQDTNIIHNLKQITTNAYNFNTNYKIINESYKNQTYSKAEYLFLKRFYDSIQPNLSNPVAVLKIIGNFEKELQNSNNYLKVEKEQLESVMSIAKSSVQYWAYGNGSLRQRLQRNLNYHHGLNEILVVLLLSCRFECRRGCCYSRAMGLFWCYVGYGCYCFNDIKMI